MRQRSRYFYLRNVSRRWKAEISKASNKVLVFSPYITSKTAEVVLGTFQGKECEIYTTFSLQNFIGRSSSIKTLKKLHQYGCTLYHLPRLHAKMLIISGQFASIGSQNLTANGTKNKEATVVTINPLEIERIENGLTPWLYQRQPITNLMLDDAEEKIDAVRNKFKDLLKQIGFFNKEMELAEEEIWRDELKRLEELANQRNEEARKQAEELIIRAFQESRNHAEELKVRQAEETRLKAEELRETRFSTAINSARNRVEKLSKHKAVERSLAEEFIAKSAYWDHPRSGCLERAPRHDRRINGSETNWTIKFGANTFLVGHAICRCQQTLLDFISQIEAGKTMSLSELRERLKRDISGAVANYDGYEYEGYYSVDSGGYMMFGNQAINVRDFINLILDKAKLDDLMLS